MIAEAGFAALPVTVGHTLELRRLPSIHRDPFDRLVIAQARLERLTLVTRGPLIRRYPVDILWN